MKLKNLFVITAAALVVRGVVQGVGFRPFVYRIARRFGLATTGIREFLNRFQRFGLIEKRPNAGWIFKGFTASFALELFEIREIFELRSALAFADLPASSPMWQRLELLREQHAALLTDIDARYHDFSDLDSRFHRLINAAAPNRFIDDFFDVITLIFHYHYQWRKHDERQRNAVAIREHLAYIDALVSRDSAAVERACRVHLASARETLVYSPRGSTVRSVSCRPLPNSGLGGAVSCCCPWTCSMVFGDELYTAV